MRCNGWSSRAISACSASAGALLLAVPASASPPARLSIYPPTVHVGQHVDLVISVPNADDKYGVDHVTLGVPGDFQLWDAEAKTGWTQSRTGQAVTWGGGRIPKGQYGRFAFRGAAPKNPETVLFSVLVGDPKGRSTTYRVGLTVSNQKPDDTDARSLGNAALTVAVVAAVIALGALAVGLYLWLRRPPLG